MLCWRPENDLTASHSCVETWRLKKTWVARKRRRGRQNEKGKRTWRRIRLEESKTSMNDPVVPFFCLRLTLSILEETPNCRRLQWGHKCTYHTRRMRAYRNEYTNTQYWQRQVHHTQSRSTEMLLSWCMGCMSETLLKHIETPGKLGSKGRSRMLLM